MERTDFSKNQTNEASNLKMFPDFMVDEAEFEQFFSAMQGDFADPIVKFCGNYECEHISGCNLGQNNYEAHYVSNNAVGAEEQTCDPNSLIWNSIMEEEEGKGGAEEEENSSETVNTAAPAKRSGGSRGDAKGDRSRTLISERRRRSKMKEKLYALRALVPNITKMDKASIVGDAALYVQELQTQAKKLKAEIATLEASSLTTGLTNDRQTIAQSLMNIGRVISFSAPKKVAKLDVFQVDEGELYVRLECSTGRGVAVSLYRTLESFTSFDVPSSNLATVGDNFVLTFTLDVKGRGMEMNLANLKLWVTGAFLNQGFQFDTPHMAI